MDAKNLSADFSRIIPVSLPKIAPEAIKVVETETAKNAGNSGVPSRSPGEAPSEAPSEMTKEPKELEKSRVNLTIK